MKAIFKNQFKLVKKSFQLSGHTKTTTTHHLLISGAVDPARDQLQGLLLDRPHGPDEWLLCDALPVGGDGTADVLTHHLENKI